MPKAFVLYIAYIFVLEYIWHETTYIYAHYYICVISACCKNTTTIIM